MRRPVRQTAVLNLRLLGQPVDVLEGKVDVFDGEEGGQVGRVRADDDEREEVPDGGDDARRESSEMFLCLQKKDE